MDHSAHSCAHNALKFCSHCNTVWCQACKVEWRQTPFCLLNHYPSYYTYPQQYIGGFGGASGGFSGGNAAGANAPTPNVTLTACAHGGD